MDIYEKFKIIENHFNKLDAIVKKKEGKPFFNTQYGIWGASSMLDAFELFMRIKLDERSGFADLGSGDGRIALIAALFTRSCGIEGDAGLHGKAVAAREELIRAIPELERCELRNADYTEENLSQFEILFTFCDHPWKPEFEDRLLRECNGVLLSYNRIFLPQRLKKGKTYWMQQLPIVSYHLNTQEKDLMR